VRPERDHDRSTKRLNAIGILSSLRGELLGPRFRRALRLAPLLLAMGAFVLAPMAARADPGDVGFEGPDGTGAGAAPSGSKPQAKLWFNDGSWWASMWDVGTSDFYIWKLDRSTETWTRTGTRLDDRNATRADVLWDGTKLYVASHVFSESDGSGLSRLYRYSYNATTDAYTLDSGFPATINQVRSETLVIDKDSTGKLWATWEQGGQIWVNRSTTSDSAWGTPFALAAASTVDGDDISTLIAFGDNKIGLMWSNQDASADRFAIHTDGQPDTTWSAAETAFSGSSVADDHLSLKTDASGRVYAAVKTSTDPLVVFLVRATNGTWTNHPVGTDAQDHTRPILIVDEANDRFRIYMTHTSNGGPIVEKSSPRGSIGFGTGVGTTVIHDASSDDMNNPTSTKQNVTSESGLIVMAFEDTTKRYWHGDIFGGGGADTTAPTVTTRLPAPGATDQAVGTNVTATFSEPVTGVSGSTFRLEAPGGALVGAAVTYDGATRTATLDPSSNLSAGTTYTARLLAGIEDLAGNGLAPGSWTFTTAAPDSTAPTVTDRVPAPASTGVSIKTNVNATFSEAVTGVSGSTVTLQGPGTTSVPASVTYDGPSRTATLDPSSSLATETTYTIRLLAGIQDLAGNPLAPESWTFTTGQASSEITFQGAASGSNVGATSLVLPRPAPVVAGDAMLATVSVRGNPRITPPAGWTVVRQDNSGSTMRQAVFVRIAGTSEPTSYTFALSKSQSAAGGIVAYAGVDPASPVDAHGGQVNASSTSLTAPSITTTESDVMLVGLFGIATLTTEVSPASMSERYDQTVPSTNKYKVTSGAHDQLFGGAGATGTRVALAANSGINIGQLVGLRPDAPAADTTAPTVTGRSPADLATDVAVGTDVTATFSEPVSGVSGTTFTLASSGGPVAASVTYDGPSRTATLDPSANLAAGTTYTASLTAGITDTAGNPLSPVTWTFTTAAAPPPSAGIAFRSVSSASNATSTSVIIPAPAGIVAGDAMVAAIAARGGPTITPPVGWTLVRQDINGSTMRQAVFVRIAGASEPTSYSFTLSNAQSAAGGIVAYSGVDPTSPIDVHGGVVNASSTSITAPSITTTGADRMLVGLFGIPQLTTVAPPAAMSERYDQTVPSTNTYKVTTAGADESFVAAGATGPRVATMAKATASIGQLLALKPAP
jgi:hypothetical protein